MLESPPRKRKNAFVAIAMTRLADHVIPREQVPVFEPPVLDVATRARLKDEIRALLAAKNAVLVAHYYVDCEIQDLAEETGGCVADSLEMARFGRDHTATTLVVAGVRFMGETAKILSPLADADALPKTLIDCNVKAERLGWLPSAPQLAANPLRLAAAAGPTTWARRSCDRRRDGRHSPSHWIGIARRDR